MHNESNTFPGKPCSNLLLLDHYSVENAILANRFLFDCTGESVAEWIVLLTGEGESGLAPDDSAFSKAIVVFDLSRFLDSEQGYFGFCEVSHAHHPFHSERVRDWVGTLLSTVADA